MNLKKIITFFMFTSIIYAYPMFPKLDKNINNYKTVKIRSPYEIVVLRLKELKNTIAGAGNYVGDRLIEFKSTMGRVGNSIVDFINRPTPNNCHYHPLMRGVKFCIHTEHNKLKI